MNNVSKAAAIVRRRSVLTLLACMGALALSGAHGVAQTGSGEGIRRNAIYAESAMMAKRPGARMPNLIGRTWAQTLAVLGFEADGASSPSSAGPFLSISHEGPTTGTVVRQSPEANQPLASAKTVVHVVLQAPPASTNFPTHSYLSMPDLTGLPLSRVYSEFGFTASGQRYPDSRPVFSAILYTGPGDGVVAEQRPGAGTPVDPGRGELSVTLVEQVEVPNLIGLTAAQAPVALRNAGLIFQAAPGSEQGLVRAQKPSGGSRVNRGSSVQVQFGVSRVSVPNLIGMQQPGAGARLQQAQLRLGRATGPSSGQVVGQQPEPGTSADQGSAVDIELKLAQVTVPNLLTLTTAAATYRLQQDGLRLVSAAGPQGGQVIRQTPSAGNPAFVGSGVSIVLGAPPAAYATVPQLAGDSQSDAILALSASNLRPGTIAGDAGGLVQAQGIPAGTQVPADTPVNLQMSAPTVAVPSLLGLDKAAALQTLAAAELGPGNVDGPQDGTVRSQSPGAGEPVQRGSQVAMTLGGAAQPLISVPDLTNLSLSAATGALSRSGLRLGHPSGPASGLVVNQNPAAQAQVIRDSTVDVTLTAEAVALVPDLRGLSDEAAAAKIVAAHLQVGPILGQSSTNGDASALVVTQSPAPGSQVPADTVVSLALAVPTRGWPWAAGGGFVGLLGASAFFYPRLRRRSVRQALGGGNGSTGGSTSAPVEPHFAARALTAKPEIRVSQSPHVQHEMMFRTSRGSASWIIAQPPSIIASGKQRRPS